MDESNCSVCSGIQPALYISSMLTLFTLSCLAGVWVRDLTQESLFIEKGTELTFTLCSCSPPGLDPVLTLPGAAQEHSQPLPGTGRAFLSIILQEPWQRLPELASVSLSWAMESHRHSPCHSLSCSRPRWALSQGYSHSFLAQLLPAVWQNILTVLH